MPALVLIHGGGFVGGSPTAMYDLCDQAAHRGFAAFAIEYRLLPDYAYPSQVQDASAAVEWLRQSAQVTKYGIDPTAVGVIGSSAGAIVASYLGVAGDGALDEGSRVAAVVALSPVTDMTDSGLALGTPSPKRPRSCLSTWVATDQEPVPVRSRSKPPQFRMSTPQMPRHS